MTTSDLPIRARPREAKPHDCITSASRERPGYRGKRARINWQSLPPTPRPPCSRVCKKRPRDNRRRPSNFKPLLVKDVVVRLAPVLTVLYVRRCKLIGVIIRNVLVATRPWATKERKEDEWGVSFGYRDKYRQRRYLSTRENLPDGLYDGDGIYEYILAERTCIRWMCDWR